MILANGCAATGFAYALWLRMRWVMVSLLIYLAVLAVTVQLFPSPIVAIGTLPVSAVIAHLLTVFTFGPADLGVRGSGFPKNMMVLPLRTRSLVFWPMIYGPGTMALLWILVATLVLAPAGVHVPVLGPAALGAAATAWLQAIGWTPFPSPFARVPALALALTPLSLLGSGLYLESRAVSISIVLASFAWIAAAYFFAVQGLSRARAGSDGEWFPTIFQRRMAGIRKRYTAAGHVRPRFRSAAAAQLWHECRRNAIFLPLMIGFISLPMLAMFVLAVINGDLRKNVMFVSVDLSPAAFGLAMFAGVLLLLGGLYGPTLGKFDVWGKEQMPSFFAIRPMTTSRFVLIKVTAAGLSALFAWGIVIALFCVWATVEASPLNPGQSLVRAALADASVREVLLFIAAMLGLLAMSWREIVTGMWPSLTGRKWLAILLGFFMMAIFGLAVTTGQWIYKHPEFQSRFIAWLPWLVSFLVALKIGAATWACIALHRARLVPLRTMLFWLAAWIAAGGGLLTGLSFVVTPTPMLVAGLFFVLPLTRLAVAPLSLHWNRHR